MHLSTDGFYPGNAGTFKSPFLLFAAVGFDHIPVARLLAEV